jgi:hypothetical protein
LVSSIRSVAARMSMFEGWYWRTTFCRQSRMKKLISVIASGM